MAEPSIIGLAPFYDSVQASRGFRMGPHQYPMVAGLEDTRIQNLLVLAAPGTGKSTLLCSVFPAYLLGRDPATTILSVSAGEALPKTFMQTTMQIVQNDRTFRETFPDVRPAPDLGWSLQRGLFVTGHNPRDENASYFSCGLTSKTLTGLHCRTMILDDLHDRENSGTTEARRNVKEAYYDTLMGRADPQGCRRIAAGRWWAEDDLYQEWIASGDWVVLQLPAVRPGNRRLWYDVFVPRGLECVYTETLTRGDIVSETENYICYRAYYGAVDPLGEGFYWPAMPSKRQEYNVVNRRAPRTASVNYRGDFEGSKEQVFSPADFRQYIPPEGLDLGILSPEVRAFVAATKGDVEQAWDTALGQVQSESRTVALTGLLVPCQEWHCGEDADVIGECDFHFDVYLLDMMVGNLNFRDLAMKLRTQYGKWHPKQVTIEEKQSGVSLLQTFRGSNIPVRPQKVVQGKLERAIDPVFADGKPIHGGAASVQGWAKMGRISYPAGAAWIHVGPEGDDKTGWMEKVCAYKGGDRGSDEFDATVHLVTRAILRSHRIGRIGNAATGFEAERQAMVVNMQAEDPRFQVLESLGMLSVLESVNPWESLCGAPCRHYGVKDNREWCDLHERRTTGIDGCTSWARKVS